METTTRALAKINNVSIVVIENGDKLIPVKPICEALGVDYSSQLQKLKSDEILSSVVVLSPTTGADEKTYEMVCIPYKFVFGWLFTINPKNVNPEVATAVTKYKLECYDALYRNFTDHTEFLEQKQNALRERLEEMERIQSEFRTAKERLSEAKEQLNAVKNLTFDEWQNNNRQLTFDFQ